MNFKRKSAAIRLLTGMLTLCATLGAAFAGVYPTAAASNQPSVGPLVSEKQISEKENSAQGGIGAHSGGTLEVWLDRALEDEPDEAEEKREKEWEEEQMAEYWAAGVTMDGKDYYYQDQLVNIFLDIRPNKSFYTLNMNPEGTVNIKIVRSENNEITGVAYMTEAEVTELFENSEGEPDEETDV